MAKILTPKSGTITVNKRMAALLELGAGFHPELLLIDEILAVGDVTFQQRCMEKFVEFREQGRTLVLVTHDTSSVRHFCDRAIWLDKGTIRAEGRPADVIDEYTEYMLGSEAGVDGSSRRGDGKIKVTKVDILVDDTRIDRVRTGDDVVFRVHFEAEEPVPNPVFAITIARLDGVGVTAPSSRDAQAVPKKISGTGHVDITMADIPLMPGPYVIHTAVTGWGLKHIYDHLHHARTFDVMAGDSAETDGLVTLRPTWTWSGSGVSPEIERG